MDVANRSIRIALVVRIMGALRIFAQGPYHGSLAMNIMYHLADHRSWVLGDIGYSQEPWLMTAIRDADPGTLEAQYN